MFFKMFSGLETSDLGCGGGGGSDVSDIFKRAGVSVVSTLQQSSGGAVNTGMRLLENCDEYSRTKRSTGGKIHLGGGHIICRLPDTRCVGCIPQIANHKCFKDGWLLKKQSDVILLKYTNLD